MAEQAPPAGVDMEGIETEIVTVDPREIVLLELNARYMNPETFRRLVENVKRDSVLTQLPFCVREQGRLKVLSGNHRVQAAIEAGLERIEVLVSKTELSPARQRAIQLSHNAIAGEDDPLMTAMLTEAVSKVKREAWLVPFELYNATRDMLDTVPLACEVRSMAVAFAHILAVFGSHLGT
ncbi:MAG: ParB N-terminal domain-containing protein [Dehalococcoidia bacterium]